MSFKINDRCAVFFAGLTRGNISRNTASSLMKNINKIKNSSEEISKVNIPKNILSALKKKDSKHKELGVGIALSVLNVKEAKGHYNSGIKIQEAMLSEQKMFLESRPSFERFFVRNFNELGRSPNIRCYIAIDLMKNNINYYSGDKIREDISGKEYALKNKQKEFSEIKNSPKEKFFVTKLNKHTEKYLQMEREINRRKDEIIKLKGEAKNCDDLLKKIIFSAARNNKESLSPKQRSLLNDLEKSISNAASAPGIIQKITKNIELLKSKRDEVSDYEVQLEHLLTMKEAYIAIKETNELLGELHSKNSEKECIVKQKLSEENNRISAVANALANTGSVSENGIKGTSLKLTEPMVSEALSGLPEVPGEKIDLKFPIESKGNNQRNKNEASLLQSSR